MFTGLVQTQGVLAERSARGPGFSASVTAPGLEFGIGDSIAVNGVCVTVAERTAQGFRCDLSAETVARTTLGRLRPGSPVNLERALRAGDALGGHLVAGHVDAVASVVSVERVGEARRVVVRPPRELLRFLAPKGSVTLDGVSLTVNATSSTTFELMLVPHTLSVTTLQHLEPGTELNLEIDLIARYAVHWLETTTTEGKGASLEQALTRAGYMP